MRRFLNITACAIGTVLVLTTANALSGAHIFFYLLFPGIATELLIAGGHGGTYLQDAVALSIGFLVNIAAYDAGFLIIVFGKWFSRNGKNQFL
jgi:hypothetical protein